VCVSVCVRASVWITYGVSYTFPCSLLKLDEARVVRTYVNTHTHTHDTRVRALIRNSTDRNRRVAEKRVFSSDADRSVTSVSRTGRKYF